MTVTKPILKKAGTSKCEELRTISFISYRVRILLRVLNRRLILKRTLVSKNEQGPEKLFNR